ncbi:MAG TPA: PAS domain-containing protein, partial [Ktedonobacteraceae bacterium]|nr:PAS domain-containing protein [Ktedonobacteraceae bacterium]
MSENSTLNFQQFFRQMLETMLWPVLVIDRSFTIHYWNALAMKLLGATDSLQGQKLEQWLPEEAMLQ